MVTVLAHSSRWIPSTLTLSLITSLTLLMGCQPDQWAASPVQIASLHTHTSSDPVYLKGTIRTQAPLLGGMAYELEDGSGSIWVRSPDRTVLNSGQEVLVKGKVRSQQLSWGGMVQTVLYLDQEK